MSFLTISATDILVPVCFKTPLLYLLTQKVAQKFGYVLGIKCKKVFKESKEVPSPPFTRNSLTIKRITKKVKGEGLKTPFYIYA